MWPSKLELADYNLPGWQAIYNTNMERLNLLLLKLQALQDVNTYGHEMEDGDLIQWWEPTKKWRVRKTNG